MTSIPDRYDPSQAESRWYRVWEERGYFRAEASSPTKKPYSIVIPPPNVTGSLHMGHALNNTLQDILIRMKRMDGHNVLWLPGTDHAGIATQNVIERQLAAEGRRKEDLGREAFVARIWRWKEESGRTIIDQLRRLGASCDWSRERRAAAVRAWVRRGPRWGAAGPSARPAGRAAPRCAGAAAAAPGWRGRGGGTAGRAVIRASKPMAVRIGRPWRTVIGFDARM